MPRTARLAVGGPAGETTDFDADHKFSQLERMLPCYLQLLSVQRCQHPPAAERSCWGGGPDPPSSRALLLGGGSAMGLGVQGGYRAVCGRSWPGWLSVTSHAGVLTRSKISESLSLTRG